MDQKYLSDDVFELIKDFDHRNLTEEQKLLIDKLILNEELKERYKEYGLCNVKRSQQNTKNYTSRIQESQLNAKNGKEKLKLNYNKKGTYFIHPQAIYTSRLFNFENLPEPKNLDD
ncbi:hypothetical protein C1645_830177 [Glomus cerebriforme]|uniref:Uncharacterized protein n=1 Tax=Glomus cerebriforme TaxID=658196 RepID=A0A397SML7_9GLOM|nr:hypothetical protein C1645_830177 [Glomus cerebriforme]